LLHGEQQDSEITQVRLFVKSFWLGEQESSKTPLVGWYKEQEDTKPPQSLGGDEGGKGGEGTTQPMKLGLVGLVGWQES